MNSLPAPNKEGISLRKTEGGIAAAVKFSGKPTDDVVREKEKQLRSSLIRDGLKPQSGCMLARYNDPGRTWEFIMVRFYICTGLLFVSLHPCLTSSFSLEKKSSLLLFISPVPIISAFNTSYDLL